MEVCVSDGICEECFPKIMGKFTGFFKTITKFFNKQFLGPYEVQGSYDFVWGDVSLQWRECTPRVERMYP